METHVIVGAGAVGSGLAHRLADAGHDVRVLTRSGSGPDRPGVERIAADATDASALAAVAAGARSLYNCANPPYHRWAAEWPPLATALLDAAEASGAVLVTMSNLYGYRPNGSAMSDTDPMDPPSRKGEIRARMWADARERHEAGRIRATEARASDFIGPGLGESAHMGDRVIPRILAGKSVSVIGDPDAPHSWTAIDDVATTLAVLGTDDRSHGRAWHVPTAAAMTSREVADRVADLAGVDRVKVKSIPGVALRVAGLVSKPIRELREVSYQFEAPFVIDATNTTNTFGVTATPFDETLEATIASYREAAHARS